MMRPRHIGSASRGTRCIGRSHLRPFLLKDKPGLHGLTFYTRSTCAVHGGGWPGILWGGSCDPSKRSMLPSAMMRFPSSIFSGVPTEPPHGFRCSHSMYEWFRWPRQVAQAPKCRTVSGRRTHPYLFGRLIYLLLPRGNCLFAYGGEHFSRGK